MNRISIFITDALERRLIAVAKRKRRPRAQIVREALSEYLETQGKPWPKSIGIGSNPDPSVTSENVKDWIRRKAQSVSHERGEATQYS